MKHSATADERTALLGSTQGPHDEEQQLSHRSSTSTLYVNINRNASSVRPMPWKKVTSILLLSAVQPLGFELIFPFINQMILEYGVVTDPTQVGFYSGLIESIFAVMTFVAILPFTLLSDHFGRRPVVLFGTMGLALSIGLFGIAKRYWFMIMNRSIGGILGGTWPIVKVMLAESIEKSHQGAAFSGIIISYRMGQIVGLPMGGLLSHPETRSKIFDTPFWHEYPFALPCFVASGFAIFAVILAHFTLEETLPKLCKSRRKSKDGCNSPSSVSIDPPNAEKKRPSLHSILTPSVSAVLISSAFLAFSSEAIFALFSLFAFTPIESGGLGMSEGQIGSQLGFRSLNTVFVTLTYAPLERRLGTVRLYQLVTALWPVTFIAFPLLNVLSRAGWSNAWQLDALLGLFFTIWSFAGLGWASTAIIVNNNSQSAESLSVLNGIAQMSTTLPSALAPALVTPLFAYSIEHEEILYGHSIWVILLSISVVGFVHSLTLKEATYDWRDDIKNEDND